MCEGGSPQEAQAFKSVVDFVVLHRSLTRSVIEYYERMASQHPDIRVKILLSNKQIESREFQNFQIINIKSNELAKHLPFPRW